ncbi:MAG TPA: HAMP domain-containing sensor histidine kinase, partial [Candidatus Obscuribacterales bacterium]
TKPVEQAFAILRDFMINVGHELNTPLSIAQAALENIERNGAEPDQMSKKLPVVKLSLTRMRNLVDDLIILARLDSSRVNKKALQCVALHEVLAETILHVQPLVEERQISLSVQQMTNAHIRGDPLQLQQMLTNLLQNAISYNKPNGSIAISLHAEQHEAVLTVADTGIGISATDLPKIFDRFYRAESCLSQMTAGSGLGLSIVKAVVDFHRGAIKVESELNAGTKVIVRLPLTSQPSSATHTTPTHSL